MEFKSKGEWHLTCIETQLQSIAISLKAMFCTLCSNFPKDFVFNNLLLIQFWMAHGILQSPKDENLELEDVGNLYMKELLSRSFFQDVEQENILYFTFKMHDLIHDLALSIA